MSSSRGDPSWHSEFASSRRKAGSSPARMALNVILLIFLVNALISLVISIIVFFVLSRVMGYGHVTTTEPQVVMVPVTATVATSSNISPTVPILSSGVDDQSTPDVYIVRSGDNLSEIAARLGITLEALMAANGIQNPDWIGVGQKLVIPKPGASKATVTVPPVPTATETPLPFEPPTPVLTQSPTFTVVVDNEATPRLVTPVSSEGGTPLAGQVIEITAIRGKGDLANEQVLFVNKGQVVDLNGWTLSDKDGTVYNFPTVVLWSGAELHLHTGKGNDTPTDLYWNQSKPVWNDAGEVATLKNAKGQVILTYHP